MTLGRVVQIDLIVDGDGPQADFTYTRHNLGRFWTRRYRCPIVATAERKCRWIDRVVKAQKMLCRTIEED